MLKLLLPLLACATFVMLPGTTVVAGHHDHHRDHHQDQRFSAQGVITAIDYAHLQLILTVPHGHETVDIPVQASDHTVIVQHDHDHTRLHFADLVVGDNILVAGALRDHILLAELIIRF